MRYVLLFFLAAGLIFWGAYELVDWAIAHDVRVAEEICAQKGAAPDYTHRTHGVCVAPDGRIVGSF